MAAAGGLGIRLVKVADPREDVDTVLDRLAGGGRRPPSPFLAAQRAGQAHADRHGVVRLDGRECCLLLAQRMDGIIHRLTLPHDYKCPVCDTEWRLETGYVDGRSILGRKHGG